MRLHINVCTELCFCYFKDHLRKTSKKFKDELDGFAPVVSNMSELTRRKTLKSDRDNIKLGAAVFIILLHRFCTLKAEHVTVLYMCDLTDISKLLVFATCSSRAD